jgi:hypothetical protein
MFLTAQTSTTHNLFEALDGYDKRMSNLEESFMTLLWFNWIAMIVMGALFIFTLSSELDLPARVWTWLHHLFRCKKTP